MNRVFFRITLIIIFMFAILGVIAYARGYRFDIKEKTFSSTGILAISSTPKAAKVFVNGKLKGVTDLNLTVPPGTYTIEIKKEGYRPYMKTLVLKGELVETIDPVLFPINPSLSPLTNLGIVKAVPVDQSDKIILISENNTQTDGIYLFDAGNKALSFFPPLKPLILKEKLGSHIPLQKAKVYFSYDYKQAIFEFSFEDGSVISYLLSLDQEDQNPFDVSYSKETLLTAWEKEKKEEFTKIIETFHKKLRKTASESFTIISFSPDQAKILYTPVKDIALPLIITPPLIAANQTPEERSLKKGRLYVYDKKEDKNFEIAGNWNFGIGNFPLWYSDSKRLVYREPSQISISSYDGTTRQIVYSGPIQEDFFAVSSDGRLLILANLNPQSNKLPDLYLVGIR